MADIALPLLLSTFIDSRENPKSLIFPRNKVNLLASLEITRSCSFDFSVSLLFQGIPVRVAWVTRSFLDYRVPVFAALDELLNHQLYVLFSSDYVPKRVSNKIRRVLGSRAIGLSNEWQFGYKGSDGMANRKISIQFHPRLPKIIRTCQPDVLVGDGFFKWTAAALLYKLVHGIPLIVCYERTFHTERNAQWFRTAYRRAVIHLVDAMCCNGKLCGEYVQNLGFPAARITYGHMVADTTSLRSNVAKVTDKQVSVLRTKHDLKGTVLLYVGKLIPRKGLIELLNAWKEFGNGISTDEATLLLVGDGPQRGKLEQYIKENNLNNIRFIGSVDYDSLAPYYKAADAFIIPTLEDNWSLVVPEAMACGLPILCSKYNGCWPELVHPGENGWVFDPLICKDVLQCLKKFIELNSRLPQMGEKSNFIVDNYTPLKAAESILHACRIAVTRRQYRRQ